jgi:histidine triad (HIT) family protein
LKLPSQQAPVHILVIPKIRDIPKLSEADPNKHESTLGKLLLHVGRIGKEKCDDNFRVMINNGAEAGQTVFHIHAHILGGKKMGEKF